MCLRPKPPSATTAGRTSSSSMDTSMNNKILQQISRKSRAGFSLVELIVVMGIISLLISILLPTLVTARRHAEQANCASNLHQIGMALISYANANQGTLPAWSAWHTWPRGTSDDTPGT